MDTSEQEGDVPPRLLSRPGNGVAMSPVRRGRRGYPEVTDGLVEEGD